MTPLTSKERAELRSQAHELKAILFIGKEGVTDATLQSLADAFNTRELVKAKVQQTAPEGARDVANDLAARMEDVQVISVTGRTVVLYRKKRTTGQHDSGTTRSSG